MTSNLVVAGSNPAGGAGQSTFRVSHSRRIDRLFIPLLTGWLLPYWKPLLRVLQGDQRTSSRGGTPAAHTHSDVDQGDPVRDEVVRKVVSTRVLQRWVVLDPTDNSSARGSGSAR
jgi:hypothetical protein